MNSKNYSQILAQSAAKRMLDAGATNYTGDVFTITVDDSGEKFEITVTTQKVGAQTPHDLRISAESRCDDLQQRLTAAEQRNAELVELLSEAFEAGDLDVFGMDLSDRLEAALKPTESGASE